MRSYIQFTAITLMTTILSLVIQPKEVQALDIDCEIPLAINCRVTDPDGFTEVRVNVDYGDNGNIDVVKKTFRNCRTNTTVSWDPIVPNFEIFTTKCRKNKLTVDNGKPEANTPVIQKFSGRINKNSSSVKLTPIEKTFKSNEQTIDEVLIDLNKKNESFKIEDRRINPKVINRFLRTIGQNPIDDFTNGEESVQLGKKRCTKWRNGRRFCVQRIRAFKWKFGWEYK